MEKNEKNKIPLPLRILRAIFISILILLLLIIGWAVFSAFDRAAPLDFLPKNYTALVHTDNIFQAAAPIVELKAADTILAEPQFAGMRGAFMTARDFFNSSNFFLSKILSRRVDAALYTDQDGGFVAVMDLSYLSAITRLANFAAGFINVKNLSFTENHFEYNADGTVLYIKPQKNLLIVSATKTLFEQALLQRGIQSAQEIETIQGEKTNALKIIANAKKIAELILEGSDIATEVVPLIKEGAFTSINLALTNDDIDVQLALPLLVNNSESPVAKILQNNSTMPRLLSELTSDTQYYTMLNLGPLADLKEAAFQIMRKTQDVDGLWKKANNLCKTLFSLTVEDLFFSWTGKECAVLGIEGSSENVFALQIADENKRREVFEKLGKSLLINTNTSLIVDGVRLPCFELPPLLASLLSVFKVTLPRPYFLVQNGFVYFSMAPQNLCAINNHIKENFVIANDKNYKRVSQNASANSSIELYYDLNRSLPFFMDNGSVVAKILRLYEIGRCNISLAEADGDKAVGIHLRATSVNQAVSKQVPGFPISVGKPNDFILHADSDEKAQNVFWLENGNTICSLNLGSLERHSFEMNEPCNIAAVQDKPKEKASRSGCLWASTASGNIYLFDKNLQCLEGFPCMTGERFSAGGAIYNEGYVVPTADGKILYTKSATSVKEIASIPDANIKSAPAVLGNTMAIYNRSFEGEIYIIENSEIQNKEFPLLIDGIGFGAPALAKIDGKTFVAFVTQSGTFYLFENGESAAGFPIEIDDVFYTNAVYFDGAFFALSENALLYKIETNGNCIGIKMPATASAKEGTLYARESKNNAGVYASGDNNILYGFDSSLELLLSFPVAGRGKPVFADVNNDKKMDCAALSISRELNVWNLN